MVSRTPEQTLPTHALGQDDGSNKLPQINKLWSYLKLADAGCSLLGKLQGPLAGQSVRREYVNKARSYLKLADTGTLPEAVGWPWCLPPHCNLQGSY